MDYELHPHQNSLERGSSRIKLEHKHQPILDVRREGGISFPDPSYAGAEGEFMGPMVAGGPADAVQRSKDQSQVLTARPEALPAESHEIRRIHIRAATQTRAPVETSIDTRLQGQAGRHAEMQA